MRPTPSTHSASATTRPATPSTTGRAVAAAALLLALAGCAQVQRNTERLGQQVHEIGCTSQCQETKDRCDADARFDFSHCQSGYSASLRDYRWCQASATEQCGYPWWSCSENRYGYCTNRYWECYAACRRTRG